MLGDKPCPAPRVDVRDPRTGLERSMIDDGHGGSVHIDGLLPGEYVVHPQCPGGYERPAPYARVVVTEKDQDGLVWHVNPGATIRGRVTNETGAPVADVDVEAAGQWSDDETTDDDGGYEITGLRAGELHRHRHGARRWTRRSHADARRRGDQVARPDRPGECADRGNARRCGGAAGLRPRNPRRSQGARALARHQFLGAGGLRQRHLRHPRAARRVSRLCRRRLVAPDCPRRRCHRRRGPARERPDQGAGAGRGDQGQGRRRNRWCRHRRRGHRERPEWLVR